MNDFPQDWYPWWTGCGAPGGHPLANVGPTGLSAPSPVASTHRPTLGQICEQSGILSGILLLVDDLIPFLTLGEIELENALQRGAGTHAWISLSKPDLLRIVNERPNIGSGDLRHVSVVAKKGAFALDYKNQEQGFICYAPEGKPEGFLIELLIEENSPSLRCVDFRREDARSIKEYLERNWLLRRRK